VIKCKVAGCSRRINAAAVFSSILLAGTCLSPIAWAQTWTNSAGTTDWGNAANWTPATVPNANTAIAQFGAAGGTTVDGANLALDSIRFNAGAPTYTITLRGGTFFGSGIVNNSGTRQNVNFYDTGGRGGTTFNVFNSASLGNANVVVGVVNGGRDTTLNFGGNATAGNATITVANLGQVSFSDNSTAGNATFVVQGGADFGGILSFYGGGSTGSPSLGTSTIQNAGLVYLYQTNGPQASYVGTDAFARLNIDQKSGPGSPVQLGSIAGTGFISFESDLVVGSNNISTTFSGTLTSKDQGLTKVGIGTLTLTNDRNFFGGGLTVNNGMVAFTSLGALGGGPIVLNGGGLMWAPGNTADVSQNLTFGTGGGYFNTGGNNVTLAGAITGPGALFKVGGGTLTL
jgi:autotransporter-associated beta strand protein